MKFNAVIIAGTILSITSCHMSEVEKQAYIKKSQKQRESPEVEKLRKNLALINEKKHTAVESARQFALENTKELNESKRSYIRFNEPHIYQSKITPGEIHIYDIPVGIDPRKYETKGNSDMDLMQTIMVWYPPSEDKPVIVSGTSKNDLTWFEPFKIVRNRLYISKEAEAKARVKAREFAMEELLYLQDKPKTQNIVCFDNPIIASTSFDLDVKETYYYEDLQRKEKYDLNNQDLKQVSFIWDNEDKTEKIVVSGVWYNHKQTYGKRDSKKNKNKNVEFLSNWIPVKAQIYNADELNNYLVK